MLNKEVPSSEVACQGWVLKKRRKKMQGFARRYFTLYHTGILQYSFEPGQPIRDQISLHHAAISTATGRKDIHIDSNTATFHLKCISTEDFNTWMAAFRKFVSLGSEARRSASMRLSRQGSRSLTKSGTIAEEMGSTITMLEDAILAMTQELSSKKHHSLNKKSEKDKLGSHIKDSRFGLFKRSSHHSMREAGAGGSFPDVVLNDQPTSSAQHVLSVLHALKTQHAALLKSFQALTFADTSQSAQGSPLPSTAEEDEQYEQPEGSSYLSAPITRRSKHTSIATTISDSVNEWFDALDGAEEYLMDTQITVDGSEPGSEPPSRMLTNESRSSLGQPEDSSVDTDIEDETNHPRKLSTAGAQIVPSPGALQLIRRAQLPALPVGDEGSLFAMLKKNVGKDLSTIAFPVTFNEPLTLLQRAAEEIEYYELLDQAAQLQDPIERICYVAAFAVSSYAHTRHRSGRKGFNPMLGETFEDVRMKFIAEKVRHNPLEMAYHAEGRGWELHSTSSGRTKFWGKSLEIIPLGMTQLKIGEDIFVWKKPSSFMRNLMVGTKYLEHCGQMTIETVHSHARCVLEFKQSGYWGASNVVSGTVYDTSGETVAHLDGKWDDQLAQTFDSSHFRVLWRMTPYPKNTHEYYGFTSFGITLNELTSDIVGKLPATDSRYRPDVRALENGDLDVAEQEKNRIEEMQRERRRRGSDRQPRWFKQVGDEWTYAGGYWEAREQGWRDEDILPLW